MVDKGLKRIDELSVLAALLQFFGERLRQTQLISRQAALLFSFALAPFRKAQLLAAIVSGTVACCLCLDSVHLARVPRVSVDMSSSHKGFRLEEQVGFA